MHIPEVHHVRTAEFGANGNTHAIALGADQLLEVCGRGAWQGTVMKNGDAVTEHIRSETVPRLSSHQHTITRSQVFIRLGFDIDGFAAILNEKVNIALVVISNRGLESNGSPRFGLQPSSKNGYHVAW